MDNENSYAIYHDGARNSFNRFKKRIDVVIDTLDDYDLSTCINDIIELYHIKKCLLEIKNHTEYNELEKEKYLSYVQQIDRILGRYFGNVDSNNLFSIIADIRNLYAGDFWFLINYYKKIAVIDSFALKVYLDNNPHHLIHLLKNEEIAKNFNDVIFLCLTISTKNIATIISNLLEKHTHQDDQIYIEGVFTPDQLKTLYLTYIESKNPNVGTLKLLRVAQNNPQLGLDDEVRLLAARTEKRRYDELMNNSVAINRELSVSFGEKDKLISISHEDNVFSVEYDSKWIAENLDYATVLNNFLFIFDFFDSQYRCNFTKGRFRKTLFDNFNVVGKKCYVDSEKFSFQKALQSMIMQGYTDILFRNDVDLEEVFKWFFEKYLKEEFGVDGFIYNASSKGTTYFEKCKNISSEIESILKQFRLYQKYGYIDYELFVMSSEHLVISNIKSMLPEKYLYPNSNTILFCMQYFFSDSLFMLLFDKSDEECENLFSYFRRHKTMPLSSFKNNDENDALNALLEFGVLIKDKDNLMEDKSKALILKNLYEKGVLCYNYAGRYKSVADELVNGKHLVAENTLFSKDECQYIDYILNKASFSDGLDLRNKYSHGTVLKNDKENHNDYIEFLKIMVMIVVKINEEFCLKFPDEKD